MVEDATVGLRVAVLVSLGRHRVSDRAGRARRDAQALELALGLANRGSGVEIEAIHAGDPTQPALRDYLGMGIPSLTVLDTPIEADAIPSLEDHLRQSRPDIILAGSKGSGGEDSGLLPYLLARALELPLISDVVALRPDNDSANLLQALPAGQRRAVRSRLPLLATVHDAAPQPRPVAFGAARRGVIQPIAARLVIDAVRADWQAGRAQNRLKFPNPGEGNETNRRRLAEGLAPDAAAAEIYRYLLEEDILREPSP